MLHKPIPQEDYSQEWTAPWGSRIQVKMHLDRLPLEPGKIRPDPFIDQYSRLKFVPAQRPPESRAYFPLSWEQVSIFVSTSH